MSAPASSFHFFSTPKFSLYGGKQVKQSPAGFHSLEGEAQREADAYDLETAENEARREVRKSMKYDRLRFQNPFESRSSCSQSHVFTG